MAQDSATPMWPKKLAGRLSRNMRRIGFLEFLGISGHRRWVTHHDITVYAIKLSH